MGPADPGQLLDFARAHGNLLMVVEAARQGYGLVERTYSSPTCTGRSLLHETRQATDDWCELFCDPIRVNTDVFRAVAYINFHWNDQPMWQAGGTCGYRLDLRGGKRVSQSTAVEQD
jgi:hypothetical protein